MYLASGLDFSPGGKVEGVGGCPIIVLSTGPLSVPNKYNTGAVLGGSKVPFTPY